MPTTKASERNDLLRVAGRTAIKAVNQTFFRGIAENKMNDDIHASLLDLIRVIAERTKVGHGALEPGV